MVKKVVSVLLCVLFGLIGMCSAIADNDIQPRYTCTKVINADLVFNDGSASAWGEVIPHDSYETRITVNLQRCDDGTWVSLSVWTGHNTNGKSEAGGTRNISTGHDYRVYVIGKVYDTNGNLLETVTKYSPTVSF